MGCHESLNVGRSQAVECIEMPINVLNCSGRLDALQEQLGHRDINTIRIYLRPSDEDVKREVARIQF